MHMAGVVGKRRMCIIAASRRFGRSGAEHMAWGLRDPIGMQSGPKVNRGTLRKEGYYLLLYIQKKLSMKID